ncbi:MAG: hypothetical protein B7Z02_06775 [Rhodobacterales bacterium 32-67-9]|nr:MAG: hypothetical protein B7Z02_06775 [Rhodobacterales bacterium 32-67-9]
MAATETDLVAAAMSGSEAAVRELIRRLNPRLFRVARGIVPSDAEAEEVVQDTYLAAFTRLAQFKGASSFSTWITRIAINTALTRNRRAHPAEDYDTVTEPDTSHILAFPGQRPELPEAALARTQIRTLLEHAVANLPADLRLPFLLHQAEGMSVLDIARDLSLNPITVKTRLFRARRRLRQALEREVHGGFDEIFPFGGTRCRAMADRVVAGLRGRGAP